MSFSIKHILGFTSLMPLIIASVVPNITAVDDQLVTRDDEDDEVWGYGVIGDSWGSGVAYKDSVLYDDNKDKCLRTKESHGPQMEADKTWLGKFKSGLRDAACSGSNLGSLAVPAGQYQMGKVGQPNIVVMTSGGNNCGFGSIADACIYHADPTHDYGPAYGDDKDREGDCAKRMDDVTGYIEDNMPNDFELTLEDIFKDPNVKKGGDFLLYVTGYAQFFGTDYDPWCNKEDWRLIQPSKKKVPLMSKEIRQDINKLIVKVNDLYKDTIEKKFSSGARYIDVDSGFKGHRFCEPGATHSDQFNKDTNFDGVYLWNLNWPFLLTEEAGSETDRKISAEDAAKYYGGRGVTAWGSGSPEGNDPKNGWQFRPLHPRQSGYKSIKTAILAQLKKDGLPKTKKSTTTFPESPTCSHISKTECGCSDGRTLKPQVYQGKSDVCCLFPTQDLPPGSQVCFDG